MSLQLAAQHLAAQGRGPDKQLVHMSPREVAGLQALAMAHGGSLSINPDTGLPEAGFLDSLLPTVIGAGLAFATGGTSLALTPAMIGLGVGGIQTLRTGDLGKGIMAGLGAYGGAGLGAGLMESGATLAANQSVPALASGADAAAVSQYADDFMAAKNAAMSGSFTDKLGTVGKGISGLATPGGGQQFLSSVGGGKELAKRGLAAAAPALMAQPKTETPKVDSEQMLFSYAPNRVADPRAGYPADYRGEYAYFRPQYTRMAQGGVTGYDYSYDPETQTYQQVAPQEASGASDARRSLIHAFFGSGAESGMGLMGPMLNFLSNRDRSHNTAPEQKVSYDSQNQRYVPAEGMAEGGFLARIRGEGADDAYEHKYKYDPLTRSYKKIEPPKPEESGKEKTTFGDTRGDSGGGAFGPGAMSSGRETDMSPFSAIAAGQALQGYGNMLGGFMPGGMLANAIGGGLVGYGQNAISQNQAALDAEMGSSISAAQNAAANEAGISAAFGNSDSSHAGSDHGAGIDASGMYNMGGITALARGGYSHLGDYSDGGRLLRGPGDGVSDSIPAVIGRKRPARLADGEFVVPARIVSELGNGSTEAGARKLYAMMDRVQRARGKTTGKGKVAKNTRAEKYLPA